MWKDHVTQLISIPFERIHYSIIPNQLSTQLRVNESSTMTFHHFQDRGATLQIVPILVLVGVNVIPKPRRFFVSGGVATLKIASYQGGKTRSQLQVLKHSLRTKWTMCSGSTEEYADWCRKCKERGDLLWFFGKPSNLLEMNFSQKPSLVFRVPNSGTYLKSL